LALKRGKNQRRGSGLFQFLSVLIIFIVLFVNKSCSLVGLNVLSKGVRLERKKRNERQLTIFPVAFFLILKLGRKKLNRNKQKYFVKKKTRPEAGERRERRTGGRVMVCGRGGYLTKK
jgi:hypothetical protein